MTRKVKTVSRTTGDLKTYVVRRMFVHLKQVCNAVTFTRVDYLTLARRARLPWVWYGNDNAETIVTLRAGLARLERAGLVSVKGLTHDDVLIRLRAVGGKR